MLEACTGRTTDPFIASREGVEAVQKRLASLSGK